MKTSKLEWCNSLENRTTKSVAQQLSGLDPVRVRKIRQYTAACMGDEECETIGVRRAHAAARLALGEGEMKESWVLYGDQGVEY